MPLSVFLEKIAENIPVSFAETIAVIGEHYHYTPTAFSNGLGDGRLVSPAGTNEGSCKIFAFAQIHQLSQQATLNLFGDYYRQDVLNDPDGAGHPNIRLFMQYGWDGIGFEGDALSARKG
ncbi:MAG: HopJ type III effector protein [Methylovulum sp.]|nr:HopJ type III effector protein [Methylovulum sp.]